MFDCIVIGDVTIDSFLVIDDAHLQCTTDDESCEICFEFGAKIPVHESHQDLGGNAANVASGLYTLGHEVALLSEIGDDPYGETALEKIKKVGIDTSLITVQKGQSTRYSTIINFESDRTVFSYHAPRKYTLPQFPSAHWVYYTSLGKSFERLQKKLIERKTKEGFLLAVNPGSYQMHKGIREFRKILPHTDLLFVNKEEAQMLIDEHIDISSCMDTLHSLGVNTVIITDGEHGSYASNGTEQLHMPIYPGNQISKTGAGDAYASGFLAAHIEGLPLATCMQWGTANAKSVIGQMGAQSGQFKEPELLNCLEKFASIKPKNISS